MGWVAGICVNASVGMTGTFPMLFIISKLFKRPLEKSGARIGINETSVVGFILTLANTFEILAHLHAKEMMPKSAFRVYAAFVLIRHLAFMLSFDST